MKMEIIEKDYKVSDRLKEVLEEKINRLNKYFKNGLNVKVACKKQRGMYKMEVNLSSDNMFYRAEVANNKNMYSNIDLVMPKLERQIVKAKEREIDKNRTGLFLPDFFEFFENEEDTEENDSMVVKQKNFSLGAPITMAEAKNMLDVLDHDFYIYTNEKTGKVNVIYRRKDGDLGNIELD